MNTDMRDLIVILEILNKKLSELHWFYSPFSFFNSVVDFENIEKMRNSDRKPVLVLDRNILSRLIKVVTEGTTEEGNTQDIAILITWTAINNIPILPYYALNEYAQSNNSEILAQREYDIFQKIFTDITMVEWLALALGFEKENKTLLTFEEDIKEKENQFSNTSIDYLSNYAAMLHLAYVLISEEQQDEKFKKYFEWFYNNLKVSRFTVAYVNGLFLGKDGYTEPKKIHGKNFDKAIRGCQNQARDLSYLTQMSIDRWPIDQYEPIFVTDDHVLGDVFINGCFNLQPIRDFERGVKKSSRKISEWVDNLLENHKEIAVEDYEKYCRKVVEQEEFLFSKAFIEKLNK